MLPSDVILHQQAYVWLKCALEMPSHALRGAIWLTVVIVMECTVMAESTPMTVELNWKTRMIRIIQVLHFSSTLIGEFRLHPYISSLGSRGFSMTEDSVSKP